MTTPTTTRRFLGGFLLACLLIAGVASYYASSHPDGLEYVAGETGFLESAEDTVTSDSPLVDYSVAGVDNERLSVGLSGIIGVTVVLALSTGLFYLLRRRSEGNVASPETVTTS